MWLNGKKSSMRRQHDFHWRVVFRKAAWCSVKTEAGAKVRLDGMDVMVGEDGRFVVGFGRDSALSSLLVVTLSDGAVERLAIGIEIGTFLFRVLMASINQKFPASQKNNWRRLLSTVKRKKPRGRRHNL